MKSMLDLNFIVKPKLVRKTSGEKQELQNGLYYHPVL